MTGALLGAVAAAMLLACGAMIYAVGAHDREQRARCSAERLQARLDNLSSRAGSCSASAWGSIAELETQLDQLRADNSRLHKELRVRGAVLAAYERSAARGKVEK